MTTGTTFFPISEHLSAAQNLLHRTTYNFTLPNSEIHQNQSPSTTRANNQQGSYDTRQTTQEPEMWERENNAPPFPWWNDFLQNISAPLPPMPEYSGRDYEDPRRFLNEMTTYLRVTNRHSEHWLRMTTQALRGEAEKW